MFRTEVVKSNNFRKKPIYKIFNLLAISVFLLVIILMIRPWSDDASINEWLDNNYEKVVQPVVLVTALIIFLISSYFRSTVKAPKRLGSLEIDNDEFRYLEDDELLETINFNDISSIEFEFYSFRMRVNPAGGMNYLDLKLKNGHSSQYEIVVSNSLTKAELGTTLLEINKKIPVKVRYALSLKKLLKDSDFKELT